MAIASLIGNFKKETMQIIQQVIEVVAEWDHYAQQAGVFEALRKEIKGNLRLKL